MSNEDYQILLEEYKLDLEDYNQEMADYQSLRGVYSSAKNSLDSALQSAYSSLDQIEAQYDSARNAYNQADAGWDMTAEIYRVSQEAMQEAKERAAQQAEYGLLSAEAQKSATEVQLAIAQSSMGYAEIKSPLSGVISQRSIEKGQMISQQSVPFTVIAMDTVNISVSVSETLINAVKPGDEVQIVIQALGNTPVSGRVTAVSPAAAAGSVYPIRVEMNNADGLIKPGMFAQVTLVKERADNTFVVPKNVVQTDENIQFVYAIKDGTAKKVEVTTGLVGSAEIEILSGVTEQDQIVVLGQEYLHDGAAVNVIAVNGERVRQDGTNAGDEETVEGSTQPDEKTLSESDDAPGEGQEGPELQPIMQQTQPDDSSSS